MKTNLLITLGCVGLLSSATMAATKAFYVTDEAGDNQHLVRLRDLSAAPVGLYVQKCISDTAGAEDFAPPTNWGWASFGNAFTNFLPPGCYEYQVGTCFIGDDDAGVGFTPGKAGQVSGSIGSADTTRRGWLRCFSHDSVAGSAYYGDTLSAAASRTLDSSIDVYQWQSDPVISNINPAYIIPLTQPPPTQTVNGVVNGTALVGVGNNILPEHVLLVEYRDQSGGAWHLLTTFVEADGSFSGLVSGPYPRVVYVRARVADAHTMRPGLPVSDNYPVTALPEPLASLVACVCMAAVLGRACRRART